MSEHGGTLFAQGIIAVIKLIRRHLIQPCILQLFLVRQVGERRQIKRSEKRVGCHEGMPSLSLSGARTARTAERSRTAAGGVCYGSVQKSTLRKLFSTKTTTYRSDNLEFPEKLHF